MDLRYRAKEVQVSDYFRVLFRRRIVVLLTFLSVFAAVLIHTFLMTPIYEAFAVVQIREEQTGNAVLNELVKANRQSPIAAEMQIIHSRTMAEAVVRELRLDLAVLSHTEKIEPTLKNVELAADNQGQVYQVTFLNDQGQFEVSYKGASLGKGDFQNGFHAAGLEFDIDLAKPPHAGSAFKFVQRPFDSTVRLVQENLNVAEMGDSGQIVKIAYRSQFPSLARDIVNKTVEVYETLNVAEKSREAKQTVDFIESQLDVIRGILSSSEDELQKYKQEKGIMMLSTEASSLIDSVAKFELQRSQLQIERFKYAGMLVEVKKNGVEGLALPSMSSAEDSVLSGLSSVVADLKSRKSQMMTTYTQVHPEVQALDRQLAAVGLQIQAILRETISSVDTRLQKLDEIIAQFGKTISSLPSVERDLAELTRSREVTAQIYTFLLTKKEESRIVMASTISAIRTIDNAVTPRSPIAPNIKLNLLMGAVAGLLLSIGVAFFLEFIDDSLKSIEEVERFVRKPIYGIIPRIPDSRKDDDAVGLASSSLVTHYSPKSPISEAFRTLRTNIQFADPDRKLTTLLVTSAGPSEGKSTIVSNLALTFANAGRKTLLVDCDLRKPNVQNIFEMERDPGLTTVLLGEKSWRDVTTATKIPNLSVIPSGPIPPNPTELLGSQHMKDLIAEMRQEFELILFDSPPVVAVTDAAILSSVVEGTLLVVELGRSRASGVNRALDLLEKVNARLLGIVTNNIYAGYRYDYGYYSYYYYYAEGGSKKKKRRRRSRYGY
jgi:tyrosine-protein kinase Etk/Wzc